MSSETIRHRAWHAKCDVCGTEADIQDDQRDGWLLSLEYPFRHGHMIGVILCPQCFSERNSRTSPNLTVTVEPLYRKTCDRCGKTEEGMAGELSRDWRHVAHNTFHCPECDTAHKKFLAGAVG